ncbi:MAG: anti-sigma factor family protein [Alphaproteobacteria bacterium]
MTMFEGHPSEEEIHRYVDGVADERSRALIERWLEEEPDELRRLDDFLRLNEALHVAYGRTPTRPPSLQLTQLENQLVRRLTFRRLAWRLRFGRPALACLGGAAVVAGMLWGGASLVWHMPPSYAHGAVDAHLVFATDYERPVEIPGSRQAELVRWLTKRVGVPIDAPDLRDAGYVLLGGRLVSNDSKPAAQFMYVSPEGRRLTLFITKADDTQRRVAEVFDGEEVRYVCWQNGTAGYVLVGAEEPSVLQAVSDRIISTTKSPDSAPRRS